LQPKDSRTLLSRLLVLFSTPPLDFVFVHYIFSVANRLRF
jgi:hypothetical protein